MGSRAKILLVIIFIFSGTLIYLYNQEKIRINNFTGAASEYEDFWLWSGGRIPENISAIDDLYILQGEFLSRDSHSKTRLTGVLPSHLKARKLWLVFRVEQVRWDAVIAEAINRRIQIWESYSNHVAGVQIDFDARSDALKDYAGLLSQVRQQLPSNYQLSVTGLLDWSNGAYDSELRDIGGIVDEVVFQTYQGRSTISTYSLYLHRLSRLNIPFKVGLIEGGVWQPSSDVRMALQNNQKFLGFVMFLQSAKRGKANNSHN